MGKASSNKKVARAAGTGGRAAGGRIAWTYYGVIAVVVVLGVVGTMFSRAGYHSRVNNSGNKQPIVGATWNEAFAVYACGKFLPPIKLSKDPSGITTQGDGIIHIHPTSKSSAGKNATLGKFASSVGMKLNAGELRVPGGKLYRDGDQCDTKNGKVYVKQFAFAGDTRGQVQSSDPRDVLLTDQALVTIAFVANGQQGAIPPPLKAVQDALSKLAPPPASTTAPSVPGSALAPGSTTPGSTPPPPGSTTPGSTAPAPGSTPPPPASPPSTP